MAVKGMFDDELILPGVITEIINDYSIGYDTSEFGSTDAVTIVGTAFNGPVGIPVPVYSPEYAKYMFGEAFDTVTRRESTLVPEIIDAWNRGCRTIYAVRISGKDMYKDFELATTTNLKLRVAGQFPCNKNKDCFMLYKAAQGEGNGAGIIRIYKPAERTTIREKLDGVVDNINSILVAEINLADNNMSKDTKLMDLLNKINNLNNNNVIIVSIVDKDGVVLTESSKEAQSLSIGDMFPGIYTLCRDKVGEAVIPKTNIELIRTADSKPYSLYDGALWKKLVINTDVKQPYPIFAAVFTDLRSSIKLSMDFEYDFLKKLGIIDQIAIKNEEDYEEVELEPFDIYKRLGQGYVSNAKIEKKVKYKNANLPIGKEEGQLDHEDNLLVHYKVVKPADDDPSRVVGVLDGIYSMLENHKTDYTVIAGLSAETKIVGSLPKKDEFKIVEKNVIKNIQHEKNEAGELVAKGESVLNANIVMDDQDFSRQVDYFIHIENIDVNEEIQEVLNQERILDGLSKDKFVRVPVIDPKQLNVKFNDVKDSQLAFVVDPDSMNEGYLVKFNLEKQMFEESDDTLLCIGVEGEAGYIEPQIIVELLEDLVVFKKEQNIDMNNYYKRNHNPHLQIDENGDAVQNNYIAVTNGSYSNIYYLQENLEGFGNILDHALRVNDAGVLQDWHDDGDNLIEDNGDDYFHILVYAMDTRSIIPLVSLRDVSNGILEENEFTSVFAEENIPKLPAYTYDEEGNIDGVLSENRTFITMFSNEMTFCSQEEMKDKFNEDELLNERFCFELNKPENALEELPDILIGYGVNRSDKLIYDEFKYIPYSTTDNFARQLAQHCLYTELKTYPTHGIIGCDRLNGVNLNIVANKVDQICNIDFDLYAKKNNGNYMLDSDNQPYPLGRCLSIILLQYTVPVESYNYASNGAAGYAGMISTLNIERSSTNQPINIGDMAFELSNYQLVRLNNKGIVCAKNNTGGEKVIVDGITQAPTTSVYRRLSTAKTINVVNKDLRKVIEPYIGLVDSLSTRNALNTAIKSALTNLKDVIIRDFKFKIYTDATDGNLGIIRIDYVIVPLNEIRQVRNRIEVSDAI